MEEKELRKRLFTFWSLSNIRNINKSFFRKYNFFGSAEIIKSFLITKHTRLSSVKGFTLVELLVVLAMVGVMFSFLIILINPYKQLEKAGDAQREHDLKEINSALDAYYSDNNCYPASIPFGSVWKTGSMVYMQKVPQDPSCAHGGSCYTYVPDNSVCPQWNLVFTKVFSPNVASTTCVLEKLSNCEPLNYSTSGYNFCGISGQVNCAYIRTISLPANAGAQGQQSPTATPVPTDTPVPTATPIPTDTPTPTPSCSKNYSCTGSPLRCNIIAPLGSGQYCNTNPKCGGNCP